MASSSLVVPVVMWGRLPPTHCVSSIIMLNDQKTIVTGCNDGHIINWEVTDDYQVRPKYMLLGHGAAITCLAPGSNVTQKSLLVSSADNGEMSLWDLADGRCIETTKHNSVHTSLQAHQLLQSADVKLVCCGYYPEIQIIHPQSLEVLCTLTSRLQSDWISAFCALRPVSREDDVVLGVTNAGTVKVWTLHGKETKNVNEDESKQLRCLNAQTLRCCQYNQRTVLIVCSKYWQIYDAGDFSLLCSESNRRGERWVGGDFTAIDRVIVWSSEGRGYLYKLSTNADPSSTAYRKAADPRSSKQDSPQCYLSLCLPVSQNLTCAPAMTYFLGRRERENKLLLRGDSDGRIMLWNVPDIKQEKLKLTRQESFDRLPVAHPRCSMSLVDVWQKQKPSGLLDFMSTDGENMNVTASIYIPGQARLVCGREDGSIVIVPALKVVMRHLLIKKGEEEIPHRILRGHSGRINCLLYPFNESTRYEPHHLVSGGVDFSVLLWDIATATKLYSFAVHGGEIQQLILPPPTCNPRILTSVCSVASDHSVALLSLKEQKPLLLASRQLFPVVVVKWRPLDDFLVAGCSDGSVYVWQMETGHLDRVVHGVIAEEILAACDDVPDDVTHATTSDNTSAPTITVAQAFRRHNLATFRNLAQQRFQQARQTLETREGAQTPHPHLMHKPHGSPLLLQGLRTNSKDAEAHVAFFDSESIIIHLLNEEFSLMSPTTLEAHGLMVPEDPYKDMSEAQKAVAGLFAKVKETAEDVSKTIETEAVKTGLLQPGVRASPTTQRKMSSTSQAEDCKPSSSAKSHAALAPTQQQSGKPSPHIIRAPKKAPPPKPAAPPSRPPPPKSPTPSRPPPPSQKLENARKPIMIREATQTLEAAQLFTSLLHAWGLDDDLDRLAADKLGLLMPRSSVAFGLLSRGGHMALLLPGWQDCPSLTETLDRPQELIPGLDPASKAGHHWLISSAVTTNHLLAIISTANTLMSMNRSSFLQEPMRRGDELGYPSPGGSAITDDDVATMALAQTKQAWSLLAALHCVLLPDMIGVGKYRSPQLEILARRWQDRCLEVREAAQALLLAELRRIGPQGRHACVEKWAPHLPSYVDPSHSILSEHGGASQENEDPFADDEDAKIEVSVSQKISQTYESRRKQATAIVMMGVIGAEFGQEMEPSRQRPVDQRPEGKQVAEGFSMKNYSHARHTSKALMFLLLQPPSARLPAFTPIRRAAIDLIGRGFTVWEPYLDVSAVLLGLLELCIDGDKLVPSMTFGLPLSPKADACRTARHSLSLIATARAPAFIITMAKEVARYQAMLQNAQGNESALKHSVLVRSRSEILKLVDLLVEKIPNEVAELIVEVMDVSVHCLDHQLIKYKGLQEVFPAICRFNMVGYCGNTRRICVGAKNGGVAFYDLKQNKCQIMPGHKGATTSVAYSSDGKYLASHSVFDNMVLLWQTASTSIFNLGSQQTKCVRTFDAPPVPMATNANPRKQSRLLWTDPRTVCLLTAEGRETKFKF